MWVGSFYFAKRAFVLIAVILLLIVGGGLWSAGVLSGGGSSPKAIQKGLLSARAVYRICHTKEKLRVCRLDPAVRVSLTIRLVGKDGAPISPAAKYTTRTSNEGRFQISLPEGYYTVLAAQPSAGVKPAVLLVSGGEISLRGDIVVG